MKNYYQNKENHYMNEKNNYVKTNSLKTIFNIKSAEKYNKQTKCTKIN